MKIILVILVALILNSCATKPTVITVYPDGRSTVISPDSSMVNLNKDGEKIDLSGMDSTNPLLMKGRGLP